VAQDVERAERAAAACDLLLAVGSTLSVVPAAYLVPMAKEAGARVVILNAEPTAYDHIADAVINGSISEVLPELVGADRQP
jgi:NAD-dependent deacetylase